MTGMKNGNRNYEGHIPKLWYARGRLLYRKKIKLLIYFGKHLVKLIFHIIRVNHIAKWIAASASRVLRDGRIPNRLKGIFYKTAIRQAMLYRTEC